MIRLTSIIAPHFWNTFKSKKPHQIDKGGRGSTKTSKNALKVIFHSLEEEKCSAIILRRYQNTLRGSVYKETKRALKRYGLEENINYKANLAPMEITIAKNGNKIYFAGADDYEKIKGMIDETRPIKIVWFEELTEFDNEEDLQQITATFSRGNDDWFINLYSYNPPKNKYHWVNIWADKMAKRDDVLVTDSDYRTVPREWLGRMFIEEAERLKKYDEKRYNWIYLGQVTGIDGLIYNPDLIIKRSATYLKENNLRILYIDFSIDCGHQTSATVVGAYGYASDGNWYRLDTYYYSPNEKSVKKAPSEQSRDVFNFELEICREYQSSIDDEVIDSAEGALRNQMFLDYGKRFDPVNKGKNKEELIEFSQEFLSKGKFFVLDTPNNSIFIREMSNYIWKKDSVERGKPEPDKLERPLPSNEQYYNTHTKDYAYTYAEHCCDDFQYWVKNNLQKLGLKF